MRAYYDSNNQFTFLARGHPVLYRIDPGKLYIAPQKKSGAPVSCGIFLHVGALCAGGDSGGPVGGI